MSILMLILELLAGADEVDRQPRSGTTGAIR